MEADLYSTVDEALEDAACELLSILELREQRAHRWGFFDTLLSGSDLRSRAGATETLVRAMDALEDAGMGTDEVIARLEQDGALRRIEGREGAFRTRYGETIRLLAALRMMFRASEWSTAPHLVSDVRTFLERRHQPRREISFDRLAQSLRGEDWSRAELARLEVLLDDGRGGQLRLSRFQTESTRVIARFVREQQDNGVIVTAGTGFGKTKAFYLPAVATLETGVLRRARVDVLAIYPRIELLRDQLREAVSEVAKLNQTMPPEQRIRLGCFYGDVPRSWDVVRTKWEKVTTEGGAEAFVCPFLAKPADGSPGRVVLLADDLEAERHRLVSDRSGWSTDDVVLTREALYTRPPDLLLITGDSLNRQLLHPKNRRLVVGRPGRGPRLLLLDEIHTYGGLQGAQYAYMLRRWRAMVRTPVTFVGLSATLADASGFLAQFCGLPHHRVRHVQPDQDRVKRVGMSYDVLVKGNPAGGTALLSTSIQLAMLMLAMLEPDGGRPLYGSKVFGFVDKLDTLNRWANTFRDSQGLGERTRPEAPLQALRHPGRYQGTDEEDSIAERERDGQIWRWSAELSDRWARPIDPDVVSSQQDNRTLTAPLVLATSSLEVGFDDPEVGAVIQHKSPGTVASFLQRKGRAGRTARMRPWTFLVLSDFGRDAELFEEASELLSGQLRASALPLANRYVLGIQGTLAFLDWFTQQSGTSFVGLERNDRKRQRAIDLLEELLDPRRDHRRRDLQRALIGALGLRSKEEAEDLLWRGPRPILLEAVPMLLRRLESAKDHAKEHFTALALTPLPEFVPGALFKSLLLPEVSVRRRGRDPVAEDVMLTLSELVPGRVTRRYATDRADRASWVNLAAHDQLDGCHFLEELGFRYEVVTEVERDGLRLPVCRPLSVWLRATPQNVRPSSTAWWSWELEVRPWGEPLDLGAAGRRLLPRVFGGAEALLHSNEAGVELVRFARGGSFARRVEQLAEERGSFTVAARGAQRQNDGQRDEPEEALAAIGLVLEVDALRFHLARPFPRLDPTVPRQAEVLRSFRPQWLRRRLQSDEDLAQATDPFAIDWLWRVALIAVCLRAARHEVSLETAARALLEDARTLGQALRQTVDDYISSLVPDPDALEDPRLETKLMDLLSRSDVLAAIGAALPQLWESTDEAFATWVDERFRVSVAGCLRQTLSRLHPDISFDELVVDLVGDELWLGEKNVGGVGLVQRLAEGVLARPQQLEQVFLDTARYSPGRTARSAITELLRRLDDPALSNRLQALRQAPDLEAWSRANQDLIGWARDTGLAVDRRTMALLYSTVLRPGSDARSDELAALLEERWRQLEGRLEIALPREVFAYVIWRADPEVRGKLAQILGSYGRSSAPARELNAIRSLLWNDSLEDDRSGLTLYSPYADLAEPSRALLTLHLEELEVFPWNDGWAGRARIQLKQRGAVTFSVPHTQLDEAIEAVGTFLLKPLEIEGRFKFFPRLERLECRGASWVLALSIPEVFDA